MPGVHGAVEDGGQQLLDVGADRGGSAGQGDVVAEEAAEPDRRVLVLRDADPADHPAGSDDPDRLLVRRHVADRLEDDLAAAVGEVADRGDALLAALGDHVGGAVLAAEIGAGLVPAHEHDPLGAELPGRQHGQQADGAVADHGDGAALGHSAAGCGVPAGAVDVGEGEQAGQPCLVGVGHRHRGP